MTQDTRPPVGSTGTLAELRVGPGDVVRAQDVFDLWNNSLYTIHESHPRGYCSELCAVRNGGSGYHRVAVSDIEFRLVSRATPDQPPHIITHNGREYDLTKLEAPFGLLMESAPPVAEALQAWPHGVEMMTYSGQMIEYNFPDMKGKRGAVWRAKPKPTETRVECYRGAVGGFEKRGTCVKRNGEILWDTWEPEA